MQLQVSACRILAQRLRGKRNPPGVIGASAEFAELGTGIFG